MKLDPSCHADIAMPVIANIPETVKSARWGRLRTRQLRNFFRIYTDKHETSLSFHYSFLKYYMGCWYLN